MQVEFVEINVPTNAHVVTKSVSPAKTESS